MNNLFSTNDPSFSLQYELAKRTGDTRYGSPCQHKEAKNGRCTNCQRKVVTSKKE